MDIKKILITGYNGQLGHALKSLLPELLVQMQILLIYVMLLVLKKL